MQLRPLTPASGVTRNAWMGRGALAIPPRTPQRTTCPARSANACRVSAPARSTLTNQKSNLGSGSQPQLSWLSDCERRRGRRDPTGSLPRVSSRGASAVRNSNFALSGTTASVAVRGERARAGWARDALGQCFGVTPWQVAPRGKPLAGDFFKRCSVTGLYLPVSGIGSSAWLWFQSF